MLRRQVRPVQGTNYNISTVIEIAANVTDALAGVENVSANITLPNSSTVLIYLNPVTGDKYNASYTIPALAGQYNVTFIANDTFGNVNNTVTTFFYGVEGIQPAIALNYPPDGFNSSSRTINFNWTATDNFDTNLTCNLTIDGSVNASGIASLNGTATNYTVTEFGDGTHTWNVTCIDDSNNVNTSETRSFKVDATQPSISLNFPPNGHSTKQTEINFSWTATNGIDTNLTCNLTINGVVNASNIASLNNTLTNYSVSGFNDGIYYWNVTCIDDFDNINTSETRQYTIDTTQPAVTLNYPPDNFTTTQTEINFNWTATNGLDTNLTCNLTIDGVVNASNIASLNNTPANYSVSGFNDGTHTWNVTCIDDSNNVNTSETRSFIVDTTQPSVTLVFPANDYKTTINFINFTWIASNGLDTNLTCNLTIDGIVNASNIASLNNTPANYTVTSFSDGTRYWNVTCIDDSSNVNTSETRNFTVDATPPSVFDVRPIANSSYNISTTIEIAANVTDATAGVDTVLANITLPDSSNVLLPLTSAIGDKYNASYTIPALLGQYNITFIANDTLNNVNNTETTYFNAVDQVRPYMILNYPPDSFSTITNSITFNWTSVDNYDTNLTCNLTINGTVNASNIASLNGSSSAYTVNNFGFGTYSWNITCTDDFNNVNTSETRSFSIQQTVLNVTLNFPPNNYLTKQTAINFTWTATDSSDTNLTCNLTVDGAVNASNIASLNSTPTNYTVTGFNDGIHYWNVTCINDANGIGISETRSFTIDTTEPAIALNFPPDSYSTQQTDINFSWTATDNIDSNMTCNLTLDSTVNVSGIDSLNNTLTNYTVAGLNDGTHYWNITCIDDFNNANTSETRSFTIDSTQPSVALNFPPDNYTTQQTDVNFSWIATNGIDTNLTCNLSINGIVNASDIASLNNTITNYTVSNFSDGVYNWNVTCIDDSNNVNVSETRQFTIDRVEPSIVLNYPPANSTISSSTINFNWTATDNVDNSLACSLTLDGSLNASNIAALNGTATNYTIVGINDGTHYWNITCVDDLNNVNTSETRSFTIDTAVPNIILNSPEDNYYSKFADINFNWTASNGIDTNLSCNLTINSIVNASNIASLNNTPTNYTVTNFNEGNYSWNITCADDANNANSSETRKFYVDLTPPNSTSPANQTVDIGQTSTITWKITDNYASGTYYVERNGVLFNGPSTWYNNTNIIILPNNYFLGTWNYTIYYNDSAGNNGIADTVFVTVIDNSTPSCANLSDPNIPLRVNITIDGNISDWDPILSNGAVNVITDLTTLAGDNDTVGTADRDLVRFSYTWDDTYLYVNYRRLNSGANQIPVIMYIDTGLDGRMNSTEKVVIFTWSGSNQKYTSRLYNYNPQNVADPMLGSGNDMPGNVTLNKTVETGIVGGATDGIRLEARLNWSEIGLPGPSPIIIQPASARGDGTILPDQLEDNMNTISTLYSALLFEPDREGTTSAGTSIYYDHDLQNCGNLIETIDLSQISSQGYNVTLYYPNGSAMTDTNGYNGPDVTLDKDNFTTVIVKIDVPSNATTGTVDVTQITATPSNVNTSNKTVTDTTNIADISILPSARTVSTTANKIIFLNYTVYNNQGFSDVLEAAATSSQGWNVAILYANQSSISDTDGDGHPDLGTFLPSEFKDILLRITVPANATIGTNDLSTIRINSSANPSLTITATANTIIRPRLTLDSSYNRSVGIGDNTYYLMTVTNNWNETDTIDISYATVNNWATAFLETDKSTPLTDSDADTVIDTGAIAGFGGTFQFYVRVSVPANATDGDSDLTTIYANSSLNTSVFDVEHINTSARILVTYKDAARTLENITFLVTETVYARAHSLTVNDVYFEWIDPNSTVVRTSPDIPVSAQNDADDFLATNINMVLGNWTIVLFNAQNDAEIARTIFYLIDNTPPSITLTGCTPDPANAGDTVTCSASITDNVGVDTVLVNVTLPNGTTVPQTVTCTGTSLSQQCSISFNQTVIPGTYNVTWFANDTSDNIAIERDNFTVPDRNPVVTLINPPANYVDTNPLFNVTFNCSATDDFGLVNISLYITNSTNGNFVLSNTTAVSGTSASAGWTLQLISGVYTWNCLAFDNGNNSDWGDQNRTISNVTAAAPSAGGPGGGSGSSSGWTYRKIPAPEKEPPGPPTKISDVIKKYGPKEEPEVREPAQPIEEKEEVSEEKPGMIIPTILLLIFILLFVVWYYWRYILGGKRRKKDYIEHKPYDMPTKRLEELDQGWVRMIKNAERQVKEKSGLVREMVREKPGKHAEVTRPAVPKIKIKESAGEGLDQGWVQMIKNAKRVAVTKQPRRPVMPEQMRRILPKEEKLIEKLPKIKIEMPKIDLDKAKKYGAVVIKGLEQVKQSVKDLKVETRKLKRPVKKIKPKPIIKDKQEFKATVKETKVVKAKQRKEDIINKMQKAMKFKDKQPALRPAVMPKVVQQIKEKPASIKEKKEPTDQKKESKDPVIDKLKNVYKL